MAYHGDESEEREIREPLIESIRRTRRRSLLAGFGDSSGHWSVSITLALLGVALLLTFFFVPRWQYAAAGALVLLSAPAAYLGMRKGHAYALPAGVLALLACIGGIALFVSVRP
ncbi:hypothetical protein CGZ93_03790 [Enemella dayhoffiae]|uniref:Uncharacterized protein n=1 Tax=Enemella dayhoffiae TaxID=2016507 RepID=A0A255HAZ6_9ACTN|nr:hypothetical protein [Enemella dayhoffiae]OYO24516.1 hypothetical protein CGZ93_03790 [Enemella dayhoffiae]